MCFLSVKKDNLTGLIAGIAVALVAAIGVAVIYHRRRKTRKRGTFMRKRYD